MSYEVKGFYNRGGWPCQVSLFDCDSIGEAIEFCKRYTRTGDFGGYEYFIAYSSDETIEGWFDESGFMHNYEKGETK